MSRKNLEIARAGAEAAAAASAGKPDIAALNRLFDREHEFMSALTGVEGRSYRGLEGYAQYREDMADAWQEWRMDVEEWIAAGPDTVVGIMRFEGRGRVSGAPVERRAGLVVTLLNGRIWRSRTYLDASDAFEATGLSEDIDRPPDYP
jgi:ketosteroid isomerase-like protein